MPDAFGQVIAQGGLAVPPVVARFHAGPGVWAGQASVSRGTGPLVRLLLTLARFPAESAAIPIRITIEDAPGGHAWTRDFGGHVTRSHLALGHAGEIRERFGPFQLRMRLSAENGVLRVHTTGVRVLGLPVPRPLVPRADATEAASADGGLAFDIGATVPLLGLLIRYRGVLHPG